MELPGFDKEGKAELDKKCAIAKAKALPAGWEIESNYYK